MALNLFGRIRARWHPLHRLRRHPWFRALIPVLDLTIPAHVGFKRRIYVKAITHAPFYLLGYRMEAGMHQLFDTVLRTLSESDAFFDLGANVGVYSWAALQQAPLRCVVSVEPDPMLAQLLRRTSLSWKARKHLVVEAAVSDAEGVIAFERDEVTTATGRIHNSSRNTSFQTDHFGMHGRVVNVNTTTIDRLARQHGAPGLVKIDVEGHELPALQGATQTLRESQPTLLIESFADHNQELYAFLVGKGYQVFDADRHAPVSAKSTNFFAVHPGRLTPSLRASLGQLNLLVE